MPEVCQSLVTGLKHVRDALGRSDVVKPFPANVAQRLPGGVGVMVDDLIAGVYVLALLWLARRAGWL